jgi:methylase of polypeptide subunit release factors
LGRCIANNRIHFRDFAFFLLFIGGEYGREVIDRLLKVIGEYLSSDGVFYLLVSSENNPDEIKILMKEKGSFTLSVNLKYKIFHISY